MALKGSQEAEMRRESIPGMGGENGWNQKIASCMQNHKEASVIGLKNVCVRE